MFPITTLELKIGSFHIFLINKWRYLEFVANTVDCYLKSQLGPVIKAQGQKPRGLTWSEKNRPWTLKETLGRNKIKKL